MDVLSRKDREFPRPRSGAVVVVYDGKLLVWGGMTQVMLGEGDAGFLVDIDLPDLETEGPVLEILDLNSYEWERIKTRGDVPYMGRSSFHALMEKKLYLFGGCVDSGFCGGLYELDLDSYVWTELPKQPNCPPAMSGGGTIVHGTSFVMFGGVGDKISTDSQYGASFKVNESFGYTFHNGWNNYLHEYDSLLGTWKELECFGERPPPSSRFTFNKIDSTRALLFGGKQDKYTVTYNDVYIFNLETKEWTLHTKSDGQKWPCARGLHVASCLVNPESDIAISNQCLIIIWGQGIDAKHVPDAWILHVQSMTWKEFLMPEKLKPRMFHMACSYHIQNCQTDVIVFGGNKQRQSKFDRNVVTFPVIIRFGSVERLLDICLNFIRRDTTIYTSHLPLILQKKILSTTDNDVTIIYPLQSNMKL